MSRSRSRRLLALVTAAAVLASMTAATVASPASAAKPKCAGKVATIVGTKKGERIVGTNKRDVIVARGGHDRIFGRGGNDLICAGTGNDRVVGGPGIDRIFGQAGRDRLFGGPGPDILAGQIGNDSLNGGTGVDTCLQGSGAGPWLNCERPVPVAPPAPALKALVVAYSDLNDNQVFDTGDVMISMITDTNGDGQVTPGDTITMDRYPKVLAPLTAADFEPWSVKTHTVGEVVASGADFLFLKNTSGATHDWNSSTDQYSESGVGSSTLFDAQAVGDNDNRNMDQNSPSKPLTSDDLSAPGLGDDRFIDVVFDVPLP